MVLDCGLHRSKLLGRPRRSKKVGGGLIFESGSGFALIPFSATGINHQITFIQTIIHQHQKAKGGMIHLSARRHHFDSSVAAVEDESSQLSLANQPETEDDDLASPEGRARTRKSYNSTIRSKRMSRSCGPSTALLLSALLLLLSPKKYVRAWGNSNGGYSESDYGLYGNGFTREWLYDGSTVSFEMLGCVWGMVDDSEEVGCLQDGSEDGTTNWYMMANCRRPQVAFSVYSSSGCSSDSFVGSVGHIWATPSLFNSWACYCFGYYSRS